MVVVWAKTGEWWDEYDTSAGMPPAGTPIIINDGSGYVWSTMNRYGAAAQFAAAVATVEAALGTDAVSITDGNVVHIPRWYIPHQHASHSVR